MGKVVKIIKSGLHKKIRVFLTQLDFLRLFLLLGASVLIILLSFHLLFWGRIFPGVSVAGMDVGSKTIPSAQKLLEKEVVLPNKIILVGNEQKYELDTSDLRILYDFSASAKRAYFYGRTGNIFYELSSKWNALTYGTNLPLSFSLDEKSLRSHIGTISATLDSPSIEPQVTIQGAKTTVFEGKPGSIVEQELLINLIKDRIGFSNPSSIEIPQRYENPRLTKEEVETLRLRAEKLIGKSLILKIDEEGFAYKDGELVTLLSPQGFLEEKVGQIVDSAASVVNRPPQNATFVFEGGRVREFNPAKDGREIKKEELQRKILVALASLEEKEEGVTNIDIPVLTTSPKIKTADVNNLGIKELIGKGSSRFRGSIPSRIHNIALAASRLNGLLIAPGEVFSFNQALGDVSAFTGYRQAYIIKEGKTILGDGGGVCQVSSTFFRAALAVGLPIVERHAHSYRVAYYEQDSGPGFDATVYAPSVDLKIRNDTLAYILIQAKTDTKNSTLTFELYGTSDGRVSETSKPRVWDVTAPPPDLYQDDPTLPVGVVRQIDFKAWGAKVVFDYKVTRNGEILQDRTFYSNFRPWQAIYLRGVGSAQ